MVETDYGILEPALDERLASAQVLQDIATASATPYGGQVHPSTGEDLLVFFGADLVYEDDAEWGVRAGLATASAACEQGLAVQIGINSGMAYIRHSAADDPTDFSVMGSVVNLVTRLRNRAGPGEVLAGAGAYRPTRGVFEYESLSMTLPGVEGPVQAYRALRPRRHPIKIRGIEGLRADMIGRQEELATPM